MSKLIRDGIDTTAGRISPFGKRMKEHLKKPPVMTFRSLAILLDHINATRDMKYLRQLRDPYSMMLLLGINKRVRPEMGEDEFPIEYTCKEVWEVLNGDSLEEINLMYGRLGELETKYYEKIASGQSIESITVKKVLRELSHSREMNFEDAWGTWVLQPDPEAFALGVLSDFTLRSGLVRPTRVTPMVGRFVNFAGPDGNRFDVRFPCIITPNYLRRGGIFYQCHKSCDKYRFFDAGGERVDYFNKRMENWPDGVFNVIRGKNGEDFVFDIICLNDVWLHNRPLVERIEFLWRFGKETATPLMVYKWQDIENAKEFFGTSNVWIRNLNSKYILGKTGSWIEMGEKETVDLRLKKYSKNMWKLVTRDNVPLFKIIRVRFRNENSGKIISINSDGELVKYKPELRTAMTFKEVAKIWDITKEDWEVKNIFWKGWKNL